MKRSTLSVIMCNYNYGKYIEEALLVIFTQSLQPNEVVVVDDGSTDNSVEIIRTLIERYPNLRLLRNEKNMGVIFTVNRCLEIASGDYVYSASSDDRILPGFFEKSMGMMEKYPEAGLCFSNPAYFDAAEYSENLKAAKEAVYFKPAEVVSLFRKKTFSIPGNTAIVKRSSLLKAGKFIPELKWHVDWFAYHVIALREGACYIPEALSSYRVLPNSYSVAGRRKKDEQEKVLTFMLKILKSPAYLDVLSSFKKSKILSIFGIDLLRLMAKAPEFREYFCFRVFWYAIKQLLKPIAPLAVKQLYRSLKS